MKTAIVVLLICTVMAHSKLRGHKKDAPLHFTSGSFEMQNMGDVDYHLDMAEAEKWDQFIQQDVQGTPGKGHGPKSQGQGKGATQKPSRHYSKLVKAKVLLEVAPIQFVDLSSQTSLISVKETDMDGKPYARAE